MPLATRSLAAPIAAALLAAVAGCSVGDRGFQDEPVRPAPRHVVLREVPPKPAPPPSPDSRAAREPAEDRRMFDEANRMRAEHGLRAFIWNDHLYRAAYDHSAEQARGGYMGHGSPDPARNDLADRLRFADCGHLRAWAEVVAWGYEGPATVVDGWMNSRGHRKILLDPNLEEAAFARVGDYFTGDFSSPR